MSEIPTPQGLPRKTAQVRVDLLERAKAYLEKAAGGPVGDSNAISAGLSLVIGRAEGNYFTKEELEQKLEHEVAFMARQLCEKFQTVLEQETGSKHRIDLAVDNETGLPVLLVGTLEGSDKPGTFYRLPEGDKPVPAIHPNTNN